MNCPLRSEETTDLLLDYTAGNLNKVRTVEFERHMDSCAECAAFRMEQAAVWDALDLWEPEPVSSGFNRELWRKIEAAGAVPWHRRFAEVFRSGAWKPAFPIAAAVAIVAVGFVFDHERATRVDPANVPASVSTGVSVTDAEQVEKALDDIQLLRQFDTAPGAASGTSKTM